MTTSINLLAALISFISISLIALFLALFLRSKWPNFILRIWIDLLRVNIWANILLLTNPQQNAVLIFGALCGFYFILFYVARSGGIGQRLLGRKSKTEGTPKVIARKLAVGLWLIGCASIFIFGQGEFIGQQLSEPHHVNTVWIDHQQNIAYDYYQQGSINTLYLYDRHNNWYGTIKADINLDNQVDVVLHKNMRGTYDREVYTYKDKQRLIFYILTGLALLALRGMQRKRKKDLLTAASESQEFITTVATQALILGLLSLPFWAQATSPIASSALLGLVETQDNCRAQSPEDCNDLALLLDVHATQLETTKNKKMLQKFMEFYRSCEDNCTPEQRTQLSTLFQNRLSPLQQEKKINSPKSELDKLTQRIATQSVLGLIKEIPEDADTILTHLNQSTVIQQTRELLQTEDELTNAHASIIDADFILQEKNKQFYQGLMRLSNKSINMDPSMIKTENFTTQNLHASQLLDLRKISSTTTLHHSFLSLYNQDRVDPDEIGTHLLTAKILSYLNERNPVFPLWNVVGRGLHRLHRDQLAYQRGYIASNNTRYMKLAQALLAQNYNELQEQMSDDWQYLQDTRDSKDSLWIKTKNIVKAVGKFSISFARLPLRLMIDATEQTDSIHEFNRAHIDLLLDIGR